MKVEVVLDTILANKVVFAAVFAVVFLASYAVLYALDFYPELVASDTATSTPIETIETDDQPSRLRLEATLPGVETATSSDTEAGDQSMVDAAPQPQAALPVSLTIEKLGRTLPVLNPTSRRIEDLDAALLEGIVRHPDSASFTVEGNMFILGHSSYLPNVFNKNFQAFNGIQSLAWGDVITVQSADAEYTYRVERVYQAKASEVTVPIAGTGPRLTLATCDSFASKDDRYVVEAKLVQTKLL